MPWKPNTVTLKVSEPKTSKTIRQHIFEYLHNYTYFISYVIHFIILYVLPLN